MTYPPYGFDELQLPADEEFDEYDNALFFEYDVEYDQYAWKWPKLKLPKAPKVQPLKGLKKIKPFKGLKKIKIQPFKGLKKFRPFKGLKGIKLPKFQPLKGFKGALQKMNPLAQVQEKAKTFARNLAIAIVIGIVVLIIGVILWNKYVAKPAIKEMAPYIGPAIQAYAAPQSMVTPALMNTMANQRSRQF